MKWSVTQKLEVIDLRDSGARWIKIAQDKGMSESSDRILKKDQIREHVVGGETHTATMRDLSLLLDMKRVNLLLIAKRMSPLLLEVERMKLR